MSDFSIAVVIPTIGAETLKNAVESVIGQSVRVAEILVVADTAEQLELPQDPRIKVLRVGPGAGGNVARQRGIDEAHTQIVCLLDDDDEWHEGKLKSQLAAIGRRSVQDSWVCWTAVNLVGPSGEVFKVLPQHGLSPNQTVSEYLTHKRSVVGGQGFIQASSLMFPRHLGSRCKFESGQLFHQDVDWVIRVSRTSPTPEFLFVSDAQVDYLVRSNSVSSRITAAGSVDWARRTFLPSELECFSDFCLTTSLGFARRHNSITDASLAIRAAISEGKPSWRALAFGALTLAKMFLTKTSRYLLASIGGRGE